MCLKLKLVIGGNQLLNIPASTNIEFSKKILLPWLGFSCGEFLPLVGKKNFEVFSKKIGFLGVNLTNLVYKLNKLPKFGNHKI